MLRFSRTGEGSLRFNWRWALVRYMKPKLRTLSHMAARQAKRLGNGAIVAVRLEILATDIAFQFALALCNLFRRKVWPTHASSAYVDESCRFST